jgi:glyoxylase-like metal-dependent hydrolase (beta-lactamase superfamily II)
MTETTFQLINTGYFYADGGSMFGATPRRAWSKRYPCDEQNRCCLAMHVGVVKTRCGRIIIIDNGIGFKQLDKLKHTSYDFFDLINLNDMLAMQGIALEDITDVVLTHLHFDHCGHTTQRVNGRIIPTFPLATCWTTNRQWENSLNPNPLEADAYFPENMDAIAQAGQLRLIENDTNLCEDIRLCIFDGHTVGQIVPCVKTTDRTVIFVGDVIPISAQVSPLWISAYDTQPLTSYHEKIRILDQVATNCHLLVHYHDAYTPTTTVRKINNFYRIDI